jgi:hypothetical protein
MIMTELAESTGLGEMIEPMATDIVDQKELAERLLEQAKEQNIELVGPDGLLGQLTKARWAMRWKPALNAFAIAFEGRIN